MIGYIQDVVLDIKFNTIYCVMSTGNVESVLRFKRESREEVKAGAAPATDV